VLAVDLPGAEADQDGEHGEGYQAGTEEAAHWRGKFVQRRRLVKLLGNSAQVRYYRLSPTQPPNSNVPES